MDEIWAPVPGYEYLYEVSNMGNVRRVQQNLTHKINERGYSRVALFRNGVSKNLKVHRLVALAFLKRGNGHTQVNHKNGDKRNNSADNLEWCTREENWDHANRMGLSRRRPVIRVDDGKEYPSMSHAAADSKCSIPAICLCCQGKSSSAGKYKFRYA